MRAVVFGLIGAVLAVGGAQAASCPITRATVTIKDTGVGYGGVVRVQRPDLVGKTFAVTRYASRRKAHFSKPIGANKLLGYEGYELKGAAGTLHVMRDHVDGSPAVTPVSWASGTKSTYGAIRWGGGPPERVKVGQDLDYYMDGPLSALTAEVTACR